MKEREYFVIMPNGYLTFIEITPERQSAIDTEYEGDVEEYLYVVLSEEFDFSVNNVNWTVVPESCITCYGRNPLNNKNMNKYIIYTTEGYCTAPDGQSIDNCQLLGRIEANDKIEAEDKFFEENPWVEESGYTDLIVAQLHESERV